MHIRTFPIRAAFLKDEVLGADLDKTVAPIKCRFSHRLPKNMMSDPETCSRTAAILTRNIIELK